ncbi:dipeptide epimerase [Halobacteriales archaeon QS_1_68_17]|nr:MAG: dipeptide epimerase [Halobacteriales archaeon QS_1_68_17]
MTTITQVTVEPVSRPLDDPFEIALGTRESARNVLVTVETDAGTVGYGEGSPLPPVTGETQEGAVATASAAGTLAEGRNLGDYRALVRDVRSAFPGAVSTTFAIETAVLDAYCRERDLPLAALFGGRPTTVSTDLTIPIVSPASAARRAERAATAGFDDLKVKAGSNLEDDVERVLAVHEAAPDAALKVDANQGWTPKETRRFVTELRNHGVELAVLEQPVRSDDVAGLARVRDHVDVPVAADEAVFTPGDAIGIVRQHAADVLNVKLGKSGLLGAAQIAAVAEAANLELMVGCMLESAIGIHASAHLVAGMGTFEYVDLDGNLLLAEDVVDTEFGPDIRPRGPGHGITPAQ